MAKKLRKPMTSLPRLFFYLLFPWLVMGGLAMLAFAMGLPAIWIFVVSLGGALAVTYAISIYEKKRRRMLAMRSKGLLD